MKLYEIEHAILECIDDETGEIVDVEKLNALQIEKDVKIENLALWYKNLLSDAEQLKAEKDAFAKREQACKNKAESLKNYLNYACCGNAFKTTKVAISYRNSESVVVDDVTKIRKKYLKYSEPTADKTAIKNAIKAGETIDGVHIESRLNIQIK